MSRAILLMILLGSPVVASAQQVIESTGSRALGMGGAFVAVADDASAVYWNPSGLVSGPPGGMTIGWANFRTGDQRGVATEGLSRRSSKLISLGTWPIGLSYGRFQHVHIARALDDSLRVEGLAMSQFGATVLQTLTPGLVVGSTIKYVRGRPISSEVNGRSAADALDAAGETEGDSSNHLDLDLGAMIDMHRVRLGLIVKNVREPKLGKAAESAITLQRQARAGLAFIPTDGLTLAIDVDLDTVDLRDGPRRMLAVGGEDRFGQRWALRGGMRWNLEGVRRSVGTLGASFALRRSFWLDGHYTYGRIDADRGFGVALRAGF